MGFPHGGSPIPPPAWRAGPAGAFGIAESAKPFLDKVSLVDAWKGFRPPAATSGRQLFDERLYSVMKWRWKIASGCMFLVGVGLGFALAAAFGWQMIFRQAGGDGSPLPVAASAGPAEQASPRGGAVVEPPAAPIAPAGGDNAKAGRVERLIQAMADDPELKAKIERLAEVPEIQAVLDDPKIVNAIEKKNVLALLANPKFRAAASHPAMRELTALALKRLTGSVNPFSAAPPPGASAKPAASEAP